MTDTYAEVADLTARLSDAYELPADVAKLLTRASELIDYATLGRAQYAFDHDAYTDGRSTLAARDVVKNAVCDQVEFWIEVGEEHDVVGLPRGSSLQGGRVQTNRLPGSLGQRALRTLLAGGLYYAGLNAR